MSDAFSITVVQDGLTPAIQAKVAALSPQRLNAAVGPACARLMQRHLRANGKNKRGWPTTNFWARAAKATSWQAHAEGVLISIAQIGVRQRFLGGHIAPVNAEALAIPISPVSYGHLPSEFPGLFILRTPKGAYLVQKGVDRTEAKSIGAKLANELRKSQGGNYKRRTGASLNFLFKLSKGVDQAADPSVLPTKEEIGETATEAIMEAVKN